MSTSESRAQINEQILEEACDWFIDCNEGALDAAGRERFNQWLRRSPVHVRAYLEIGGAWEDSDKLNGGRPFDPAALVARPTGRKVAPLLYALAAAALLALGMGVVIQRDAHTTTTGIGEQRSIVLEDGSAVELNVRSRLRVRFSRAERRVELVYGQALFQVKKDAVRPFVVVSSGTCVQAVGTQFDVYRKAIGTVVTVVEGRVAVTADRAVAGGAGPPVVLSTGEQLIVTPQATPHPARIDVAAATAWTQRKLVFDETPLAEAVAEFNRYNSRQMIIADASLADYHIRGKFAAGDPDRLLQFLRDRFDVDVHEQGDEIRISRK
jgi:transmembrane sensor